MKLKLATTLAISLLAIISIAPMAAAQSIEVAGTSVTATNDLLVFLWLADEGRLTSPLDVSAITHQKIAGSVVRWRTRGSQFDLERVAGVDPNGHLLVFSWSTGANTVEDWHVLDLSSGVSGGTVLAGPITTWQTPDGPFLVDHIGGVSPNGELVVFYWSTQAASENEWNAVNISALTRQKAVSPLTSWQTQEGQFNVEHVAGASPEGDLLVFSWNPATDWQVLNVSNQIDLKTATRPEIAGPLTSWQSRIPLLGSFGTVDHVAGVSPSGDLLVLFRNPGLDLILGRPPTWQFVNVSERTLQKLEACVSGAEPPCAMMDSWAENNGDEFIAAAVPGDLIAVFYSLAADHQDTRWGVCDMADTNSCVQPQ
jgi:hypothetical protein